MDALVVQLRSRERSDGKDQTKQADGIIATSQRKPLDDVYLFDMPFVYFALSFELRLSRR